MQRLSDAVSRVFVAETLSDTNQEDLESLQLLREDVAGGNETGNETDSLSALDDALSSLDDSSASLDNATDVANATEAGGKNETATDEEANNETAPDNTAGEDDEASTGFDWLGGDAGSAQDEAVFEGKALSGITRAHNVARWWHSQTPLCWDPCLAATAHDAANRLKDAGEVSDSKLDKMTHVYVEKCGEKPCWHRGKGMKQEASIMGENIFSQGLKQGKSAVKVADVMNSW